MSNDIESLSHTKWRCQYHIVFAPKWRYIREYLQENYTEEQRRIKEYVDPFTGEQVKEGK